MTIAIAIILTTITIAILAIIIFAMYSSNQPGIGDVELDNIEEEIPYQSETLQIENALSIIEEQANSKGGQLLVNHSVGYPGGITQYKIDNIEGPGYITIYGNIKISIANDSGILQSTETIFSHNNYYSWINSLMMLVDKGQSYTITFHGNRGKAIYTRTII